MTVLASVNWDALCIVVAALCVTIVFMFGGQHPD